MRKHLFALTAVLALPALPAAFGQTNPAITRWLQNTTNVRGRHYISGNSTLVQDTAHANVQRVRYSASSVYINCSGIPAYVVGPYLDNNPSQATNRKYLFKLPLNPVANTGTATVVTIGHTGLFINGVPVYNFADNRSYNSMGVWNQNAIAFENAGFDCAKGHPSPVYSGAPGSSTLTGGSYHHHQNPSAFNIATVPMSTVCNVYLADGLYVPNANQHGPLIGFAFDGFPIYGGYGYTNPLQASAIKRMVPSYRMRNMTDRTTLPNGSTASQVGPTLSAQALGSYAEDFEYVAGSGDLDSHNGRLCVTPEYPQGTYAYFATIDANGNSAYPYVLGPTYYGVVEASNFPAAGPSGTPTQVVINETVTTYAATTTASAAATEMGQLSIFPSPTHDLLVVQAPVAPRLAQTVELLDLTGRVVARQTLFPGSTMCYFDTQTLHAGTYLVRAGGTVTKVVVE